MCNARIMNISCIQLAFNSHVCITHTMRVQLFTYNCRQLWRTYNITYNFDGTYKIFLPIQYPSHTKSTQDLHIMPIMPYTHYAQYRHYAFFRITHCAHYSQLCLTDIMHITCIMSITHNEHYTHWAFRAFCAYSMHICNAHIICIQILKFNCIQLWRAYNRTCNIGCAYKIFVQIPYLHIQSLHKTCTLCELHALCAFAHYAHYVFCASCVTRIMRIKRAYIAHICNEHTTRKISVHALCTLLALCA